MSEDSGATPAPADPLPLTAGGLLRQARQAKGLHIAALATAIKVAPRKLELLEGDRLDELPGATFVRALAQTVCRFLKIDSTPVLALLPSATDKSLEHLSLGLNAPFRDRPGQHAPKDLQFLTSPLVLGVALLLLATAAVYLLPAGWINDNFHSAAPAPAPAPTTTTTTTYAAPVPAAGDVAMPPSSLTPSAPPSATAAEAPKASAAEPLVALPAVTAPPVETAVSGALLLRASAQSWIEVVDGRGSALMSRLLQPGETVGLDGASPLRVRIGNANATTVTYKGKPVELVASRDNVAKLELK